MDKVLRPSRLDTDPSSQDASSDWLHWKKTFENFIATLPSEGLDKCVVLTNFVTPKIYQYIADVTEYDLAIETLGKLFIKPQNEVCARHVLATRNQHLSESVREYMQVLRTLSKDCNFQQVTAVQHQSENIRDSFIRGLSSSWMRQRLLENVTLRLEEVFNQACTLEAAAQNAESYRPTSQSPAVKVLQPKREEELPDYAATLTEKCFFCGNKKHPRSRCPARGVDCYKRQKKGVLDHLCCDILLGIDFQAQHSSVVSKFGGNKTTLTVCGFTTLGTKWPTPFKNLTADCHPVAVRSRKYSQEDRAFINEEVRRLLKEGIIEPSQSPWRAQVVVVKGENP